VTLSDLTISGDYGDNGEYKFTNGIAYVKLSNGEEANITGLPNNVTATVTETQVTNMTTIYQINDGAKQNGNSAAKVAVGETVTFTNTRNEVDVKLKKNVKGNMGDVNKKFSFTVVIMDANGSPLANFNNETITTDANGKVTKPISLKHGEIFDFGNLPVGAKVTITEENPDYPALPPETINSEKTTITRDDISNQLVSMEYTFIVPNQTCTVIYTNEREIKVDTGVANDMMPYVLLLGFVTLAGAGLLMGRRRRRAI
jgi:plastocyanin